jgi:hypothetical protein
MRNRMLFGILVLLLCSLAFTAPSTAVNIPGCGEFVLLSQTAIRFEQGPTELFGNVLVTSPTGLIQVGANNIIHGTVTANTLNLGTGAQIDRCEANVFVGVDPALVCGSVGPATFPTCPAFPPIPAPTVDPCVDSAANFTVAAGDTATLPAGSCVGVLRVNLGGTLNVSGTINVQSVRLLAGSSLIGPATINVKGQFLTEAGTQMDGLTLNLVGTAQEILSIGVGSQFLNGLINAPFGGIHLHSSLEFGGSEAISRRATVEPIKNIPPPPKGCPCPATVVFVTGSVNPEIVRVTGEDLLSVTSAGLSSTPDCNPANTTIVPILSKTDVQIDLNVTGLAPGTYTLFTVSGKGSCCWTGLGTVAVP